MRCPNCGREMQAGYFYAHQAAAWTPKPNKRTFFMGKEDVDLTEKYPNPTPAHICKECRSVTIEY